MECYNQVLLMFRFLSVKYRNYFKLFIYSSQQVNAAYFETTFIIHIIKQKIGFQKHNKNLTNDKIWLLILPSKHLFMRALCRTNFQLGGERGQWVWRGGGGWVVVNVVVSLSQCSRFISLYRSFSRTFWMSKASINLVRTSNTNCN